MPKLSMYWLVICITSVTGRMMGRKKFGFIVVQNLPINLIHLHSTIHALNGCGTTNKVVTKLQAFMAAHKTEFASVNKF